MNGAQANDVYADTNGGARVLSNESVDIPIVSQIEGKLGRITTLIETPVSCSEDEEREQSTPSVESPNSSLSGDLKDQNGLPEIILDGSQTDGQRESKQVNGEVAVTPESRKNGEAEPATEPEKLSDAELAQIWDWNQTVPPTIDRCVSSSCYIVNCWSDLIR